MARVRAACVSVFNFRSVCSCFENSLCGSLPENSGVACGGVHPNPYYHTRLTCICKQFPRQFSPRQEMAGKQGFSMVRPADRLLLGWQAAQSFSLSHRHTSPPRQAKRPRPASAALVDLLDRRLHFFHHASRQRGVAELACHLLTVGRHPVQKVGNDLPFLRILSRRRNQ
jgi:hypothetical protein